MKKLGLIGGIGPESTIAYYRDIAYGVQKRLNAPVFPPLVIESLSVFDVLRFCDEQDYDGLTAYLLRGVRHLAAAGAVFAAVTGNTPHVVFAELAEKSPVPLVSIVETACSEALHQHFRKIALLGTEPTMKADFFKRPFREKGIDVVTPDKNEMKFIGAKISEELELGIISPETRSRCVQIVNRMIRDEKIDAVVLGCTELPLLFKGEKLAVPYLDTMKIHVHKLIDMILSE